MMSKLNYKKNFTIIELMVVVAIVAALFSLLMPSLSKVLEHNNTLSCQTNLKTYYVSNELYADDNHDIYVVIGSDPWTYTWFINETYLSYFGPDLKELRYENDFACPNQTNPSFRGFSYAFNWYNDSWSWSKIKNKALVRNRLNDPAGKITMVDHTDWHSAIWSIDPTPWFELGEVKSNRVAYRHNQGTNAMFGDGHVEYRMVDEMFYNGDRTQINQIWRLNGEAFYSP